MLDETHDEIVARLLHQSLSNWYQNNLNQAARFGPTHLPFIHFPTLYRHLDPEHCLGAWHGQQLAGVAFLHPRPTHVSVGIIATNPTFAGRGIAKMFMTRACAIADQQNLPLRLVSSLLNLDSFSLYSRCGLRPVNVYQDILLSVPNQGFAPSDVQGVQILSAHAENAREIAHSEFELCGVSRTHDHLALLCRTALPWEVLIARDQSGTLIGSMTFTQHPDWNMLGPGFARDEAVLLMLILHALRHLKGRDIVILVPSDAREILSSMYRMGGRNIELHALQVRGAWTPQAGISLPTFLPETF